MLIQRLMTILLCLCLTLFLVGCATPSIVTKPQIVEKTRWKTLALDPELLQTYECPDAAKLHSTEDLVNAYQACWTANDKHNADKRAIQKEAQRAREANQD